MLLGSIGRIKIYTDVEEITKDNVLSVLRKAYALHRINAADMQMLIDYEAGDQPLPYRKTIRPEINICTVDNMANYVTEFHKGYFWGTPTIYTQRGNKEHHNTDEDIDSEGISALNEMMLNGLSISREDQKLADFVEKTGIGHRFIRPRKDWDDETLRDVYAEDYTLDSRFAFCVYHAGVGQKKLMGVSYSKVSGRLKYTCFTDKYQFNITGDTVEAYPNLMGMIPIVEFERSVDRTGCFERQISLMDNLNSLVSNFANDVAQNVQALWWGNDIEFPVDPNTGEERKPKNGEWLITQSSGQGQNQKVQPLMSGYDTTPTLEAISNTENKILKYCFVPMQYASEGGGSTGVATDTMSGWNATAVDADRKECLIEGAKREELILLLKAINLSDTKHLPADDPLRKIHSTDIDIKFTRRQNYDLSTKANTFATLVSHGVNGRHALKATNMFDDVEQVYIDSKKGIEKYQASSYGNAAEQGSEDRLMQDTSDQVSQSPAIDGLNTDRASEIS